ncbi:MAG1 [Candida pseudojiufengensis]|uniref:MAG1 n=1 Tax=Candida pseudojiufengensis TaxID=497109 RepID=UPI002225B58F|nr:MAG1 [Candida pseudojiufengensis]KAI5965238.1 MAG1 [Candida pseudojiufengensis]
MGAITRSNKSGAKTAENTSQVYTLTDIPTKINLKDKPNKVSKPKSKTNPKLPKNVDKILPKSKPSIEKFLDHENVPKDLELPKEFIEFHTPAFIEGLKFCIEKDPTLYPVIVKQNFEGFGSKQFDEKLQHADADKIHLYWYSLIRSIIAQQVSGAAAKSIENKYKNLFKDGEVPTAEKTKNMSDEELKKAGISGPKIKYVKSISEEFTNKDSKLTDTSFYANATVEEIYEEICKLKGVGIWSAKMFALFTLEENDVFAEDDLGVARGMAKYLEQRPEILDKAKKECDKDDSKKSALKKRSKFFNKDDSKRTWKPIHDVYVLHIAEDFKPFRSAFMMILWRLSSTNVEALEI